MADEDSVELASLLQSSLGAWLDDSWTDSCLGCEQETRHHIKGWIGARKISHLRTPINVYELFDDPSSRLHSDQFVELALLG
jgi:hypothetical protein